MFEHLIDTNVLSQVLRGNTDIDNLIKTLNAGIDTTVCVEMLQGQKKNREKQQVKKYLDNFPLAHFTPAISRRTIDLIDKYSNAINLILPDSQIAATCLEYDLTLVAYNTKHFAIKGLKLYQPPFKQI